MRKSDVSDRPTMIGVMALMAGHEDWFTDSQEFTGNGRAEFSGHPGVIEAPARVRVHQCGGVTIEMEVVSNEADSMASLGPLSLFCGHAAEETAEGRRMSISGPSECTGLTVTPSVGVLKAEGQFFSDSHYDMESGRSVLRYRPLGTDFEGAKCGPAKYWVLPLTNFLCRRFEWVPFGEPTPHPSLNGHPLRIHRVGEISAGLAEPELSRAQYRAGLAERCAIRFQYNAAPAFIEAVPDYPARRAALESGQELSALTAVVVGELPPGGFTDPNPRKWSPFDLLPLLSIATGVAVGAPWIELRDAEGRLVRRHQRALSREVFSPGTVTIDDVLHGGVGQLLTTALESPHFGTTHFAVAARHLVAAGVQSGPMTEDRFDHLARAYECLGAVLLDREFFKPQPAIVGDIGTRLESILQRTRQEIRQLARTGKGGEEIPEADALDGIADRALGLRFKRHGFGASVGALARRFELPDGEIATAELLANPRSHGLSWPALLGECRVRAMHVGYFDIEGGEITFEEILQVFSHLNDLLTRILLKLAGYEGKYQPTVAKFTDPQPLDWVNPDTPASRLGYS